MYFPLRSWVMAFVVVGATSALAQAPAGAAGSVDDVAGDDVAVDAGVASDGVVEGNVAAEVVETAPPPTPRPALDDAVMSDAGAPLVTTTDVIVTFLKAMAALGIVLALAWLTLGKGIPKLVEKAQAGKRVKVLERIALDARRSLFLVEIDGRLMVLGGGDIVKVHDLQEAKDAAKAARFAEVLSSTPPSPSPSAPPPSSAPPSSGPMPPAEQS